MKRIKLIQELTASGVVAVIRAASADDAIKMIEAVKEGGVRAIEITMTVPGAVDLIKDLTETYKGTDVIIGAGTVLDSETARACILAGAAYIVSPGFDKETVELCNLYRVPVMPGVMTVTEVMEALKSGVEIVKVFPGSAFGPGIIKAFKGPLPQGNYMPTGGVSLDNVKDWIKAGAVAVGVGGDLTGDAKNGRYDLVTEKAEAFIEAVREARKEN
jgi:2-dehydro-3-deoxyphosphogluconate aldolase/(4S)-4-hydroxy-2-oxoglutarate aldolase